MSTGVEPSGGHGCKVGIIRWPRLQIKAAGSQTKVLINVVRCVNVVRVEYRTRTSTRKPSKPADVSRWFYDAVQRLWPVADGSLSLRKSSCIRTNCPACAAGEGHRSYVLYGRRDKKRFSIYVPDDLVPE